MNSFSICRICWQQKNNLNQQPGISSSRFSNPLSNCRCLSSSKHVTSKCTCQLIGASLTNLKIFCYFLLKNLLTNFFRYLSSSPTVPSSPTWNEKRVPLATLPQVTQQELLVDEKELELQVRILFYWRSKRGTFILPGFFFFYFFLRSKLVLRKNSSFHKKKTRNVSLRKTQTVCELFQNNALEMTSFY